MVPSCHLRPVRTGQATQVVRRFGGLAACGEGGSLVGPQEFNPVADIASVSDVGCWAPNGYADTVAGRPLLRNERT